VAVRRGSGGVIRAVVWPADGVGEDMCDNSGGGGTTGCGH
jgi:hypothetical protein